jgi:hypothetical protein
LEKKNEEKLSLFQIALGKCRNQEKCEIPKNKKNFDAEVNKKVWNLRRRPKLRNAERCFSLKYDDCKAETSVTTMLSGVLFQVFSSNLHPRIFCFASCKI